jgi:hypothetical protein
MEIDKVGKGVFRNFGYCYRCFEHIVCDLFWQALFCSVAIKEQVCHFYRGKLCSKVKSEGSVGGFLKVGFQFVQFKSRGKVTAKQKWFFFVTAEPYSKFSRSWSC